MVTEFTPYGLIRTSNSIMAALFYPKKRLGQHFLVDQNIARRVVDEAGIDTCEMVLEIGPGKGVLTELLLSRADRVIAVEIDRSLTDLLKQRFGSAENFILLEGDILKINLEDLLPATDSGKMVVVADLPYYITSPVIFKLLSSHQFIDRAILMVQREVAHRIVAKPGSKVYGILSLAVRLHADPALLFDISPECFRPRPKVYSSLLRLDFFDSLSFPLKDEKGFFMILRAAFGTRRKMLKNALRVLGLDQDTLTAISDSTGIDLERRAETLTLEEFGRLSNVITGILKDR
ncbi:MAG TPA: ribosomal RNA small subunit methyltransferase A [Candidatus Latescibacteria bacterium]|nr:ribosomal RNA small subunit methyltransferase A [Candidatus Latescibacterota bacterium]